MIVYENRHLLTFQNIVAALLRDRCSARLRGERSTARRATARSAPQTLKGRTRPRWGVYLSHGGRSYLRFRAVASLNLAPFLGRGKGWCPPMCHRDGKLHPGGEEDPQPHEQPKLVPSPTRLSLRFWLGVRAISYPCHLREKRCIHHGSKPKWPPWIPFREELTCRDV